MSQNIRVINMISRKQTFKDEAKNEPLLGGLLSPELNLFDQILP